MASACVNNFIDCPPSYGWLSPRVSISRDNTTTNTNTNGHDSGSKLPDQDQKPDLEPADFEFRLEDPVAMLPADELFSDGKLVPLHLSYMKPENTASPESTATSPEATKSCRRPDVPGSDPHLFSPKAPRCSSRWKELLGLKKLYQSASNGTASSKTTSSSSSSPSTSTSTNKSLKNFLHRGSSKTTSFSSENASLSLPLLKDHSDCESVSISSSRLSLSSSSSGHEHDDLPRLSLDSEKPNPNPNHNPISIHRNPNQNPNHHPRMRLVKARPGSFDNSNNNSQPCNRVGRSPIRKSVTESGAVGCRGVSVDSPRLNSSGKIVFQSLERSSSSPSSFNGGPRFKQRGMERSYSANVRVTPVLNVPVCSLRGGSKSGSVFGFGQLFSVGNGGSTSNKGHQHSGRNR